MIEYVFLRSQTESESKRRALIVDVVNNDREMQITGFTIFVQQRSILLQGDGIDVIFVVGHPLPGTY